jgi:hypothetical protein
MNYRNTLVIIIIYFSSLYQCIGQFQFEVIYDGYISSITNKIVDLETPRYTQKVAVFTEYPIVQNKLFVGSGLGFLQTGNRSFSEFGDQGFIKSIKFVDNYNYVFIPTRLKYSIRNFLFIGSIDHNFNIGGSTISVRVNQDDSVQRDKDEVNIIGGSIGGYLAVFDLGVYYTIFDHFILGVKGMHSLNQVVVGVPRDNKVRGVGMSLGYKFN